MAFPSLAFLVFFAVVLAGYYLTPRPVRWVWLLAASLWFYLSAGIQTLPLLAVSVCSTYAAARYMDRVNRELEEWQAAHKADASREERKARRAAAQKRKRLALGLALLADLGLLAVIKYTGFALDNLGRLLTGLGLTLTPPEVSWALPLGLSFYTFTTVGYCLDVYRGTVRAERNLAKYALFATFFPHITQGPISRFGELAPQLLEGHPYDYVQVTHGLQRMAWGAFEKLVVADRLALLVNTVWADPGACTGLQLTLAILCYAIQIYADFAGYMDMAVGAAQAMGITLAENFKSPYFSTSIPEFWRRWHITLGSWFREYLFYPVLRSGWCSRLGKGLKGRLGTAGAGRVTTVLALIIVWSATGLWHGASWHYVAWGLWHGGLIILSTLFTPWWERTADRLGVPRRAAWYRVLQGIRTFALVCLGYVFFRSSGMAQSLAILRGLLDVQPGSLGGGRLFQLGLDQPDFWAAALSTAALLAVDVCRARDYSLRDALDRRGIWLRWPVYLALLLCVLVFGMYGPGYDAGSFIYQGF